MDEEWNLRNITDVAKVDEIKNMYESLGFFVRIDDFDADKYSCECNKCMIESPALFKVVFTKPGNTEKEELFDE